MLIGAFSGRWVGRGFPVPTIYAGGTRVPVTARDEIGHLATAFNDPAGGSVTVKAELRTNRLVVEVTDTGTGIAAADLPRVFDRFWRADHSRDRATRGSGLGLSIARQLARVHGGDLTAASKPGHGSTFTVDLPT